MPAEGRHWARFSLVAAALSALLAIASLAVRWHPEPFLAGPLVGLAQSSMRINSAVAVLALSLGLAWRARPHTPCAGWPLLACVAVPLMLAGLSVLQSLAATDMGVDGWFGLDRLDHASAHPGRMTPGTALSLGALALALLFTGRPFGWPLPRLSRQLSVALVCVAVPLPYIASVGQLYRGSAGVSGVPLMLATGTAVLLLGSALLALQPARAQGPQSVTGRFLLTVLPMVTLLPAALAWVRLVGESAGWYATDNGVLSGVLLATALLLAAGWLAARWLVRFESALHASQSRLEARVQERTAELERALGRLSESEDRFRQMAEAAPALIWVTDDQRRIAYVNEAWQCFIGSSGPSPGRDGWRSRVHPQDRLSVLPLLEDALARGSDFAVELRMQHHDGQWRWIDLRGVPRQERCGRYAGHVGVGIDVHDAKMGALELQAHQRLLSTVIDSVSAAIVSVDERHRIVLFNHAAERIFGLAAEAMRGQPLDRLLPERLRAGHDRAMHSFAREGVTSRPMGAPAGLVGLRANGEEFPIEASISRVDRNGRVLMTAVLHDMTAARALDQERDARRAAEQANTAKSRFLSHLSHELRTPLNAVIGFSQLLLADPGLSPSETGRRYAEHILQAGRHQLAMINDLLDLSRIEAGQMGLAIAPVALGPVLRDSVQLVLPQAATARITLAWQAAAAEGLMVQADAGRLRQVLVNLLSNAIKYNRPEGRVDLEVKAKGRLVSLAVRDTGLGLTEAQIAGLFQPFNRLGREASAIEGTGIGLSLTRRLVQMMGGGIEVQSTPAVGSVFTVTLPLADGP